MPYWLVSLPLINKRRDTTWERLQENTSAHQLSNNHRLEVPELRVGTLDTLMALSDDLSKTNNVIDAIVTKIKRQVQDIGGAEAVAKLKVDGIPVDSYITTRFKWDEAKFPLRRALKETVEKITDITGRIEDDLKVKVSEYNTMKSAVSAAARKSAGSLSVRDISTLVKPNDLVDSENLTTLFVVVQKFSYNEWQGSYETMCKYVVPRSSKVVAEDQDYVVASVVLFKRVVDDFRAAARSKGFQVREYQKASDGTELTAAQAEQLKRDVEVKKSGLETWCKTAFGEAFSCWMHVMVIRLFVESILRYGLPPAFLAAVLKPAEKSENALRAVLGRSFGDGKAQYWKDDGSSTMGAGLAGDIELYPYVSFTMNLE